MKSIRLKTRLVLWAVVIVGLGSLCSPVHALSTVEPDDILIAVEPPTSVEPTPFYRTGEFWRMLLAVIGGAATMGTVVLVWNRSVSRRACEKTEGSQGELGARERTEKSLRESELLFRATFEQAAVGIVNVATDGAFLRVNQHFCDIVGYSEAELLTMKFQQVTHPDDLASDLENLGRLLAGEIETFSMAKRYVRKDQAIVWVSLTVSLLRDEGGQPEFVIGAVRDITDEKRTEQIMREIVVGASTQFGREFFNAMAVNLASLLGADYALIGEVTGPTGQSVRTLSVCADGKIVDNFEYALAGTPCAAVVGQQICSHASGVAAAFPDDSLLREMSVEGYVGVPLFDSHNNAMGIMVALYRSEIPNTVLAETILQIFASRTAAEIERVRAEQALREGEEKLRLAMDATNDGLWDWNVETGEVYYSPSWSRILGEESVGSEYESWASRLHPDEKGDVLATLEAHVAGRTPSWQKEYRLRTRNDEWKWVLGRGRIVSRDAAGKALRMVGTMTDISAHKAAEAALRQQRDFAESLIETAPAIVMIVDADGRIVRFNRYLTVLSGLEQADVQGEHWYTALLPDVDVERGRDLFANALAGQSMRGDVAPVRAREGEPREIQWYGEALKGGDDQPAGRLMIGLDVTERRRAQRDYRSIFNEMLDGFALHEIICDEAGKPMDYRFLAINPAFERLTGLTAEAVIGQTVLEVIPQTEAHWIDTYGQVAMTGEAAHFENYSQDLDRHYEVTAYRPAPGQFACIFVDVSERKRAEGERRQLEAQIQHAQKLESLGVLAGGIAHDFNNLLMVILGNADLALMELSPVSPATENVGEIKKASQRAAELCKQMLAYSGKGRFVIEPVDLSHVVEELSHMLEISISKKAILKYNFVEGLPAVEADITQIRQIIMNLITNASEAIGDKSGIISITTGAVDCDRAYLRGAYLDEELSEGCYVTLEVADTGCGMDAETQAKLFDPFFTTKFTGRGLGLAAVLGIVRGHGGTVKVYSEVGRGTTFKVLLPACVDDARANRAAAEAAPAEPIVGTVLLADDEETVRKVAKRMLERMGLTVLTAEDGREAVETYRQRRDEIDCVILDLTMPHMDGEEAFRELRRIQEDVCVVVSSGYNQQEVTQRFLGKGLAGFIQKPYQMAALGDVMREALDEGR